MHPSRVLLPKNLKRQIVVLCCSLLTALYPVLTRTAITASADVVKDDEGNRIFKEFAELVHSAQTTLFLRVLAYVHDGGNRATANSMEIARFRQD